MELPLMIDINLGLRMSDAYTDMVAIISQRREEIRELENDIDEIYTEIQNIIPN